MSHICLTYHIVWRTKYSHRTINEEHERDLFAYIFGFCKKKNCKLHRINSMPDHIHMCVEIHPTISLSEFMKVLKQESSQWLREHKELFRGFESPSHRRRLKVSILNIAFSLFRLKLRRKCDFA